jgi:hypothetical protein
MKCPCLARSSLKRLSRDPQRLSELKAASLAERHFGPVHRGDINTNLPHPHGQSRLQNGEICMPGAGGSSDLPETFLRSRA